MSRRPDAAVIAIHGGAGTIARAHMTASREKQYREALRESLEAGYAVLARGGAALDAVTAAVAALEDDSLFNAGHGAVCNAEGRHELDAAVMEGASLRAGAVACVGRIRNPVLAARAVMAHSPHVLLAGEGAERFAGAHGLALVPQSYFATPERLEALRRNLKSHHGTVGAVARDRAGNLAAATSTGGYTGKLPGRIGDSPLIGAGTYADNRACAVSATGPGELFIRTAAAHDIAARLLYRRQSLGRAAAAALAAVARLGGDGGLVAVDRRGNLAMPFTSQGMYRASVDRRGRRFVGIY